MSDWTIRLPYAHRYITKTWFEGAEADLDLPEEIFFVEPHMCLPEWLYSRWSTKVHLGRIGSYYYEFSVDQGPERYEWLAIGYTANLDEILYGLDGSVLTDVSNDRSGFVGIPYGEGDTIGCGYEFPSRFFFTKNGIYLSHYIAQLELNTLRPEMRAWTTTQDCRGPINLGQRAFMFDIEGHFDRRYARLRRLATSLPLEILENIFQFALLSHGTNHLPVPHLSHVCRRWHTLFFRSTIDLCISTHKHLEDLLKISRARIPIHTRNVTTQESPTDAWLTRFFVSLSPHIKSTSMLAIRTSLAGEHRRFLDKAPSFLSQGITGILRHTFTEVHTLQLSNYSFPTWTRFAQVVFALQRLETLMCSSVTWDTSPSAPPSWLTFSKRLRCASFEDMGRQCIAGSLWLFLAGRPRQFEPSDDLVLIPPDISIIGQLASLILRPNFTIVYDQKQDQPRSCTLTFTKHSQLSTLSFGFEGNGATHQLARIYVRLSREAHSRPDYRTLRAVGSCSTALSSSNSCRFCFELSEMEFERSSARRHVAKAMIRQHTAGLLECTWNGETIADTKGVQWVKTGAAVTFGIEKTHKRGTSGNITWDVEALRPHFAELSWPHYLTTPIMHWIKLYKHVNQSDLFIADVAFNVDVQDGHAQFFIPDRIDPGWYFLAVGDYVHRTRSFQVI